MVAVLMSLLATLTAVPQKASGFTYFGGTSRGRVRQSNKFKCKSKNAIGMVRESTGGDEVTEKPEMYPYSARYIEDNGLELYLDDGRVTARPTDSLPNINSSSDTTELSQTNNNVDKKDETEDTEKTSSAAEVENGASPSSTQKTEEASIKKKPNFLKDHPHPDLNPIQRQQFNIVLTHCMCDFDSLASAVGLAKVWSKESPIPTFVVLPRGAHPGVTRFLALHKHLFPIRSLRSLPSDLSSLNKVGLVDAQRRDRVGPAEHLLTYAKSVTIFDHHIDKQSDIPEATDYVVEKVGSVSTMLVELLIENHVEITEAEATLLALGIHADTGSLCFDSTTPRDAMALGWVLEQGASQPAIAEHVQGSLSKEQQDVLTMALLNTNSTKIHGVTVSTVLLSTEGFINGLAAVTQDTLELSGSDIVLLAVVYDAKSKSNSNRNKRNKEKQSDANISQKLNPNAVAASSSNAEINFKMEAWKGGEEAMRRRRLKKAFDRKDLDGSGHLDKKEIAAALASSGIIATSHAVDSVLTAMDTDSDGQISFEEFLSFSDQVEQEQKEHDNRTGRQASTLTIIGRVKTSVNLKHVNLNKLFEQFGGGGHAKAASATVRLGDESEAEVILENLVQELIETSLLEQPTVGDFMTAPVLSARPDMTEKQVEDLFTRYDVRALPVVDDNNDVVGLVTYKEVAAAKQRLWNKEQKRLRNQAKMEKEGGKKNDPNKPTSNDPAANHVKESRKLGSALKGWMKSHVKVVEATMTFAEVEAVLLENDVGCIPVVADGTKQLVGMVTRTDLLRQHKYYPSLHYHNKGFSDSIAARKPIIELRKKLKRFDLENE